MKTKNGLGKFSYFVVIASTMAGVVFASQGSASASVGNGWTATRIAKDVVTGIGFATGATGGAVKQVGDYVVDHPAKAVAKVAPVAAVMYLPIFPGVGVAWTAVSSVKSVMKWFKK